MGGGVGLEFERAGIPMGFLFWFLSLRVRGGACWKTLIAQGQPLVDPSLPAAASSTTTTTCVACCVVHEGEIALTGASTPWLGGEEEYCVVTDTCRLRLAHPFQFGQQLWPSTTSCNHARGRRAYILFRRLVLVLCFHCPKQIQSKRGEGGEKQRKQGKFALREPLVWYFPGVVSLLLLLLFS